MAHVKRLTILSAKEIEVFFGIPQFDDKERSHYFSLSKTEYQLMQTLSASTRWYFILQLGYFKAKKQFFMLNYINVKTDLNFIARHYECHYPYKNISEETHRKIRALILKHLNYQDDIKTIKSILQKKSQELTYYTTKPKAIFEALYDFIAKSQFIMPHYSTLQQLIGQALKQEKLRLNNIIQQSTPKNIRQALNKLLTAENTYYDITLIKKDQKDFSYSEVTKTIQYKNDYHHLYEFSQKLMPRLFISNQMIDYYASMINYYSVAKLKKLPTFTAHLYLFCYIFRRMNKLNDNLMNSFVYYVDKYTKIAKEHAKECVYQLKLELSQSVKQVPNILRLFITKSITDKNIRSEGFKILPEEKFEPTINYMAGIALDEHLFRWEHYDKKQSEIVKNLRPIFMSLEFTCSPSYKNLGDAIAFLKAQFNAKIPLTKISALDFPIKFIPKHLINYIIKIDSANQANSIHLARFEFCVYWQIRKGFKENEVTLPDSISYKDLTNDLVPRHKQKAIMGKLDNVLLSRPFKKQLSENKNELDELYQQVNQRIENGENKSVKLERQDNKTRFILQYNAKEDLTNHDFFSKLPQVTITDVLNFAQQRTGFLHTFTHIKPLYAKATKDNQSILAAILANATHHGIYKMAAMSNIDYQALVNAEHNFIRLDTLKMASDCLSNAIAALPIFSEWSLQTNRLHASVDGQKFQTRIDVLQARHSAKYFPLKKGIVAYTLLANFIPLSVETISPNLHESYFLFDILKNMTADIALDYVSGDSHSINPVNFLLTRYLPIQFAPHLVHINSKIENLYSFSAPNQFKNLMIKPHYQVDTDLILSEEDNMNWIITSLLQGEVRQNIIIRKLSSLARHHRTCQAMAEYNRVFESIYTLNYIDNPSLRQYVRGSLNRLEAYHQLRRAIALGNGGEFRGNSELELAVWNECARLIANAIVYYNACLLSALLKKYKKLSSNKTILDVIKRISPIAWVNINMLGKFDFFTSALDLDIERMVDKVDLF